MSFVVTKIDLPAIPNVHGGTGNHQSTNWVVDPASVPGSGDLVFAGLDCEVDTLLFSIADNVVPNWFGVAVPRGITDFTLPHLFFHPTPGQAGYVDGDYPTKSGLWPHLFYYMERLGYQLDGARRNQVLIMPFMTEARKDAGVLITDWQDIFTQILTQVRTIYDPSDSSPLAINQLVVSSFSAGMIYSDAFRRHGAGVDSVLAEIWDFDGRFSTYHWITEALHSTAQVQVIKYDQLFSADTSAFHLPLPRWSKLVNPPTSNMDVHALIRDFMFLDGATVSGVGSLIPGPAAGPTTATAGTHTTTSTPSTATGTPVLPGGPGDSATGAFSGSLGTITSTTWPTTGTTTATANVTTATSIGTADTSTHTVPGTISASHPPPDVSPAPPPPAPAPQPPVPSPPPRPQPQIPAPAPQPAPTAPAVAGHTSACATAAPAIAATSAAVAQTSITSIAAVARMKRRRR